MIRHATSRQGRRAAARVWTIAAALAILAACVEEHGDPFDDAACARLLAERASVEAVEWFKTPSAEPKRLGGLSNPESLALVHEFEARGAARILAVAAKTGAEGLDRGDIAGLVIILPESSSQRLAVFRLYAATIRNAGFKPRRDDGQRHLFLPATPRG